MFPYVDHTHHVPDFVFEIGNPSVHDPISMLRLYAPSTDAWEATHPSHRRCFIGHPCYVTGDKYCARTSYLSMFHHAYGTCHRWSPDHIYCRDLTSDIEKEMFPECAECGVLVEIWDLILINRRLLDDKEQVTTVEDRKLVQNSIGAYIKAYELRRAAHVAGMRNKADDLFEAQVRFAKEGIEAPSAKTTSWWLTLMDKFAAFIKGLLMI